MYCMNVVKSRPLLTPDGKEELLDGARHGISPLTALLPHNWRVSGDITEHAGDITEHAGDITHDH